GLIKVRARRVFLDDQPVSLGRGEISTRLFEQFCLPKGGARRQRILWILTNEGSISLDRALWVVPLFGILRNVEQLFGVTVDLLFSRRDVSRFLTGFKDDGSVSHRERDDERNRNAN